MKLHTLPLSPQPPALPTRPQTQADTTILPFQAQPAIDAVQATTVRRNSGETRGNAAGPAKQAGSQVATPILNANDTAARQPYRRGALVDISA